MKNWAIRWAVSAVALGIVAQLGIGVTCDSVGALLTATIVIGLANAMIRPILGYLTAPLNCLTFGLFGYILNALMFLLATTVPGFASTLPGALLGSIIMGLLGSLLSSVLTDKKRS